MHVQTEPHSGQPGYKQISRRPPIEAWVCLDHIITVLRSEGTVLMTEANFDFPWFPLVGVESRPSTIEPKSQPLLWFCTADSISLPASTGNVGKENADDDLVPYLEHKSSAGAKQVQRLPEKVSWGQRSLPRARWTQTEADTRQRTSCRKKRALSLGKTTRAQLLAVFRHCQYGAWHTVGTP